MYSNVKEDMIVQEMSIGGSMWDTDRMVTETTLKAALIHNKRTQHIFKALYRNNIVKPVQKVKHAK